MVTIPDEIVTTPFALITLVVVFGVAVGRNNNDRDHDVNNGGRINVPHLYQSKPGFCGVAATLPCQSQQIAGGPFSDETSCKKGGITNIKVTLP